MSVSHTSLDEELSRVMASDPEALRDPWPTWRALREHGPVYQHGEVTLVTRHADVRTLAKDLRLSSAYHAGGARADAILSRLDDRERAAQLAVSRFESMYVSRSDGEAHNRLRQIMGRAFTPRRIAKLTEQVETFTERLLRESSEQGEFDWMSEVAIRLPLMVIAELLGVPQDDIETIRAWSSRLASNRGGENATLLMDAHEAMMEFRDYVEEVVVPRRHELGGSELARAFVDAEEGETLSPEETTAQFVVLLFAGFETTSTLIGSGLLELLRHPDQWRLLREQPARTEAAIDELLRWVTPVQWIGRFATEEIEIAGTVIRRGQTVYPCIATANRDPEAFAEPERFDLTRSDSRRHLSFGLGPHFCLGNALARIEARAALEQVARDYPDVELHDDDPPWGSNAMLRSIQRLPVELGPRRER